jgi:hypothetical protein
VKFLYIYRHQLIKVSNSKPTTISQSDSATRSRWKDVEIHMDATDTPSKLIVRCTQVNSNSNQLRIIKRNYINLKTTPERSLEFSIQLKCPSLGESVPYLKYKCVANKVAISSVATGRISSYQENRNRGSPNHTFTRKRI